MGRIVRHSFGYFKRADHRRRRIDPHWSIAGGISEAIPLTALGLPVAIVASWSYTYLSSRLENFDLEMQNASLDLVNQLILYRPR